MNRVPSSVTESRKSATSLIYPWFLRANESQFWALLAKSRPLPSYFPLPPLLPPPSGSRLLQQSSQLSLHDAQRSQWEAELACFIFFFFGWGLRGGRRRRGGPASLVSALLSEWRERAPASSPGCPVPQPPTLRSPARPQAGPPRAPCPHCSSPRTATRPTLGAAGQRGQGALGTWALRTMRSGAAPAPPMELLLSPPPGAPHSARAPCA